MISALSEFMTGISELRWHVAALDLEWALLDADTASPACSPADAIVAQMKTHIGVGIARRRFEYNSIIISLYGILEQYIEGLLRGFVATLNSVVPRYPGQPDAIRNTHVALSISLLNRAEQSRFKGTVTAEQLVANLHSCLSDATPYRLNTDAFCLHNANFRADVVDEAFAKVGISGASQRLKFFDPMSDYLAAEYPDRNVNTVKPEEMFFYLNDLAERRNEVAHGAASELLKHDLLLEYVRFVEAYGISLYELVYSHSLEQVVRHKAVEIGSPIKVINYSVVCMELKNTRISVGDTLIAVTGQESRPYKAGEIVSLHVNNAPLPTVDAADSVLVGAMVQFHAKENYIYWLLPRE